MDSFYKSRIILLITTVILCLLCIQGTHGVCSGQTCGECISSDGSCAWCTEKNFTEDRCQTEKDLLDAGCPRKQIENPQTRLDIYKNENVRDSSKRGSTQEEAVQLQPQEVYIRARPGIEHVIPITFRAANNYPVYLYFLFDISSTMKGKIKKLEKLTDSIGDAIQSVSNNYTLGYGVFQDKRVMPFTDTTPDRLNNPCLDTSQESGTPKCAPSFEFKHKQRLTEDRQKFKIKVNESLDDLTGNIDHPEGSTDAIMQAVVCKDKIGWKTIGRKLLIFASDDRYHLAGDGKFAGIVTPNDGECHLDNDGSYTEELTQDYPSVGQLANKIKENEVHVIFAVPNSQFEVYKALSERIPDSTVDRLGKADRIDKLVKRKYLDMVSQVKIVHSDLIDGVEIKIRARSERCRDRPENVCKGIQIGKKVKFDVHVKITKCPENIKEHKVEIYPDSLKNDKLELVISFLCECDCKTSNDTWEEDSSLCSGGNGTLKCGQCDCHDGRFGSQCECDRSALSSADVTDKCVMPGSNSSEPCNGNGLCECAQCVCDPGYTGKFCECNTCGIIDGEVCGGPMRAKCVCGACVCTDAYEGAACDCPTSNETCIFEGSLCNGYADCECGKCTSCRGGHIGSFCETNVLKGDKCDIMLYRKCATCSLQTSDIMCPDDCPEIELVDAIDLNEPGFCSIKDADGCFLHYRLEVSDSEIIGLIVQQTKECSEEAELLPIVFGVFGGLVVIVLLLLLLWKFLTTLYDRIEYAKFQDDLQKCKWAQHDNPFYKCATTTYSNPMLDKTEPLDPPM